MKKFCFMILIFSLLLSASYALEINKVEPPNWWNNMEKDTLTLLIYGDDFTGWEVGTSNWKARILDARPCENSAYFLLKLKIRRAGVLNLEFRNVLSDECVNLPYEIRDRKKHDMIKLDPSDVVYLLMPDRFADGSDSNNLIPGHKDPVRPRHKWGRRGGDIRGVLDHLDYLDNLGISALWMTPVYENDYINCYHGYTPTDLYKIEPHLGTLEEYRDLVKACHQKNIAVIHDHIVNHISPSHPLAQSPPEPNWLNGTVNDHLDCNYSIKDVSDSYGPYSRNRIPVEGWFAGYLADMNMANPDVVDYFINHTIWWIETMGLDGIREDTYSYSNQNGLAEWGRQVKKEYPDLFLLAEVMEFDRVRLSYFFNSGNKNHLTSLTDFGLSSQIYQLILEELPMDLFYRKIANDHIYQDPDMMLTFMDNHDMGRFFTACKEDVYDYINAFTLLFSMRGIVQIYYGDEIGMPGGHDPDNRGKFPGGFPKDRRNAFTASGRARYEQVIFDHFQLFCDMRERYSECFQDPMKHDYHDSVYMVYRSSDDNSYSILTLLNTADTAATVSYKDIVYPHDPSFGKMLKGPLKGSLDIFPGKMECSIPPNESAILLFIK